MAKKKRRRRRSFTVSIAVIGGLAAGMVQPVDLAIKGRYMEALGKIAFNYAGVGGIAAGKPKFDARGMINGLVPLVAGGLVHKFVGGKLGINKMIADAGVPIIRV